MARSKWRTRVRKLLNGTPVKSSTVDLWYDEANRFPSCATGERMELLQSVGVQFNAIGEPLNPYVRTLSMEFEKAFGTQKYERANQILDEIDAFIKKSKKSLKALEGRDV